MCHKAFALKNAQTLQSKISPTKLPTGTRTIPALMTASLNGVALAVKKTPIMSGVIPTPTTPINSTVTTAVSKRKDLSPSVNGPPVAEDKCLKTMESVAVTLLAPSLLLQNSNISTIPSKIVRTQAVFPMPPQNSPQAPIFGQRKKQL